MFVKKISQAVFLGLLSGVLGGVVKVTSNEELCEAMRGNSWGILKICMKGCPPCEEITPVYNELSDEMWTGQDVVFLAADVNDFKRLNITTKGGSKVQVVVVPTAIAIYAGASDSFISKQEEAVVIAQLPSEEDKTGKLREVIEGKVLPPS